MRIFEATGWQSVALSTQFGSSGVPGIAHRKQRPGSRLVHVRRCGTFMLATSYCHATRRSESRLTSGEPTQHSQRAQHGQRNKQDASCMPRCFRPGQCDMSEFGWQLGVDARSGSCGHHAAGSQSTQSAEYGSTMERSQWGRLRRNGASLMTV
jgi:hypothetical protein